MRYQETFELRDNEMRQLSAAETNEVTGGAGTATVFASGSSGVHSAQLVFVGATLATSNTSAFAEIRAGISAAGPNNFVELIATASS